MNKSNATSKENALANALTPQQIVEELDKYIIGLFENLFFNAPDTGKDNIVIDAVYVRSELSEIIRDQDLSRYIL